MVTAVGGARKARDPASKSGYRHRSAGALGERRQLLPGERVEEQAGSGATSSSIPLAASGPAAGRRSSEEKERKATGR
ncbi:hypothetical protein EYF80_042506 [Liparis tanakae]|uniref:Uncharacterized protein n=1 Tax=Liparis tanakae TaxID=230148 RepID=A0A4Z2G199_9TELE|nr:hypothetical protein EYF80_042506 [Liparis tanakae]